VSLSHATDNNYLLLAIESTQDSIIAGNLGNDMTMLDNLESAKDFTSYANEKGKNPHLQRAIDNLGEAISHIIAGNIKESIKDATNALYQLRHIDN